MAVVLPRPLAYNLAQTWEMSALTYVRLVGFTAGTLLYLFWLVMIVGFRRPRNFERIFFFLALALFLFYSGSLLAVNAQIYYPRPPVSLATFAITLICAGLCFLPPLIVHLHAEYGAAQGLQRFAKAARLVAWATYVPAIYFGLRVYPSLASSGNFDFLLPGNVLGVGYGAWLALAMLLAVAWEWRFARSAAGQPERRLHLAMTVLFALGAVLAAYLHAFRGAAPSTAVGLATALMLLGLVPGALAVYFGLRFNFLQIGRQKNLVYAVSATFLALLYLSAVRRVGTWLEPAVPPELTAAILLFVLVVFFEPLQRWLGAKLRQTLHQEVDRLQRLAAETQLQARQGDLRHLMEFIERRVKEDFDLADTRLELRGSLAAKAGAKNARESGAPSRAVWSFAPTSFALQQADETVGVLEAVPHGAALSGETRAALEFLCEQLPAMLDLCCLIEEKLTLERELAERERLALVGQMAASISHNLKNPLGAMKTILQAELESPDLPENVRKDSELMLGEMERLNRKVQQLLTYSRPAVRLGNDVPRTDLRAAAEQVVGVLGREAERRSASLLLSAGDGEIAVFTSTEALSDVLTNLVVNAIEAVERGGRILVTVGKETVWAVLQVEDDGPGIPPDLRDKVLQPFFSTKPQGTGLGLAVVARRVAEMQGELKCESPVRAGRGTRFTVRMPLADACGCSLEVRQRAPREAGDGGATTAAPGSPLEREEQ
jgi:signal transduction histidine kinase